MSDYSNLFGMFGDKERGFGPCPPPGPGPCPPPGPGPCPPPVPGPGLGGFGGGGILIWIIILCFFCGGGFGFGGGCGNNSGANDGCGSGCGCGGRCGCGGGFDTGCCTTMFPNPCDFVECCNCCGKRVKKCKKQKNYIVEACLCGGNAPMINNTGCGGCGNSGFGCGNGGFGFGGFWWIIILIILFVCRGGGGFLGGPSKGNVC